jgi:hypothetical protein
LFTGVRIEKYSESWMRTMAEMERSTLSSSSRKYVEKESIRASSLVAAEIEIGPGVEAVAEDGRMR